MVKSYPLTAIRGGINRLRIRGGASPQSLYDLVNAWVTVANTVKVREGTSRAATLNSSSIGLCYFEGTIYVFTAAPGVAVPAGYQPVVLLRDDGVVATPQTIWFAQPFMGFLYVVCEWSDGAVFHYWLQAQGAWSANTVYQAGAIVTPAAAPNGLAYQAVRLATQNPTWSSETAVALNKVVEPTIPNGYMYTATSVEGTQPHTGQIEPTWPASSGAIVQEFGDFAVATSSTTDAPPPLAQSITDRYGDSSTIANTVTSTGSVVGSVSTLPTASLTDTVWVKGTYYQPGAVVTPSTNQGAVTNAIPNGDFAAGNDGNWVFGGTGVAWSISNVGVPYNAAQSAYSAINPPGATTGTITMATYGTVTPGQSVTATAKLNTDGSSSPAIAIQIGLNWYDNTHTLLSTVKGPVSWSPGGWSTISVTGTAPANAAYANVTVFAASGTSSRGTAGLANVAWSLEQPAPATNFLYEAVQAAPGTSGSAEPAWPTILGNTVVDGGVTWQAVGSSITTWTASPIMKSGATEPVWPTTVGLEVADNNMAWRCISRRITDTNCPNTTGVTIGESHVFAVDNDIVSYSAAVDPTDWTSPNNAGYLPTGLNNYGSNPMTVLALYRGNLMAFNSAGYQMWQIDPDPQNMAILDAQPVGSTFVRSAQSVANDLLILTILGVRNIGTTGATANLNTGQLGQPVDTLIQADIASVTSTPISCYYPAKGQYWLIFHNEVFVLTINGNNQKSWSRYVFPDSITDVTLVGEVLYMRTAGNLVWELTASALVDDYWNNPSSAVTISDANPAVVTWNAHGLIDGTAVSFTTTGALPAPLAVGTTYYVVNATTNTFELALTQGGAAIATTSAGSGVQTANTAGVPFSGLMQWPYINLSAIGLNDMITGFDLVGTGSVTVSFGYDETNVATVTNGYYLSAADTVPGQPIGFPVNAPSVSPTLLWAPNQAWEWQAMSLYNQPTPSAG